MSRAQRSIYTQEFKLSAVQRMAAGENVAALAKELGVLRKSLYAWRDKLRIGGPEALHAQRPGRKPRLGWAGDGGGGPVPLASGAAAGAGASNLPGGPPPPVPPLERPPDRPVVSAESAALAAARQRIAVLEQKIGRQALELDFFRNALQHFKGVRRPNAGPGVTASMPSSGR